MFAARLRDVIENRADPVYQDPTRFFENTYPTQGLRTLATEALGRLKRSEVHGRNRRAMTIISVTWRSRDTRFGFRSAEALIALALLSLGGLCPSLPSRQLA
jgi:hypothetical protein